MIPLPPFLHTFFWDYDPGALDVQQHAYFVMERLMERGSWEAMQWLLTSFSSQERYAFLQSRGRRVLTPTALNYWAIMSDTPETLRRQWLIEAKARNDTWSKRVASQHPQ